MNNSVKILTRAMEVLDERGWCQGWYVNQETGAVCALGAVIQAHGLINLEDDHKVNRQDYLVAEKALYCVTLEEAGCRITDFNDQIAESVEDVKLVFKKAIYKLEK